MWISEHQIWTFFPYVFVQTCTYYKYTILGCFWPTDIDILGFCWLLKRSREGPHTRPMRHQTAPVRISKRSPIKHFFSTARRNKNCCWFRVVTPSSYAFHIYVLNLWVNRRFLWNIIYLKEGTSFKIFE